MTLTKPLLIASMLFAVTLAVLSPLSVAPAKADEPAVIIIVDADRVVWQSKVGKNIRSQLQALKKKVEDDNRATGESLQTSYRQIQEQLQQPPASIDRDALRNRMEDLQTRQQAFEKKLSREVQGVQLGADKARKEVEKVLRPIFQDVMKKHGANIVMDRKLVLVGAGSLDVTEEVLKALDAKISSIPVTPQPVPNN